MFVVLRVFAAPFVFVVLRVVVLPALVEVEVLTRPVFVFTRVVVVVVEALRLGVTVAPVTGWFVTGLFVAGLLVTAVPRFVV